MAYLTIMLPCSSSTHGSDYGSHQQQQSSLTRNNPHKVLLLFAQSFPNTCTDGAVSHHAAGINNRGRCERSLTSFLVPMATNEAGSAVFHGAHQRGWSMYLTWNKSLCVCACVSEWNIFVSEWILDKNWKTKYCTAEFCRESVKVATTWLWKLWL